MKKMRILLTGAAGYLGQVLYPFLIKLGYKVIAIDNFMYGQNTSFPCEKVDITNQLEMFYWTRGIDVVIALAGIVGDTACGLDKKITTLINQKSTEFLAEICEYNKVSGIIFASTASVYGKNNELTDETGKLNPMSLYACTKIKSEKILLKKCHKTKVVILRFGTLFGYSPRMRFDLAANIMTAMAVKEGKIIVRGGKQSRPMLYLQDALQAIDLILNKKLKYSIYNVATANCSISMLAQSIADIIGAKIINKLKQEDTRNYIMDCKRIEKLGFKPNCLVKGIKEMMHCEEIKNYKDDKYYNEKILQSLST